MKTEQIQALSALLTALTHATETGALDHLVDFCRNPDSINDVCDSVVNALAEQQEMVG